MGKLKFVGGVRCAGAELLRLPGLANGGQAVQDMSMVLDFAGTRGQWQLPQLP